MGNERDLTRKSVEFVVFLGISGGRRAQYNLLTHRVRASRSCLHGPRTRWDIHSTDEDRGVGCSVIMLACSKSHSTYRGEPPNWRIGGCTGVLPLQSWAKSNGN